MPSRSFLLDKLNKWVSNNGSGEPSPRTLVLSAPNSSGKSHCLKEFCLKRNKSSSNEEIKLHHVVYYEFFGGGPVLRPEQTCEHAILYFLTETIKILDIFQNTPTTFDQTNLEEEDALTLFNEYLLYLLQSAKQQHNAEICFVIDGPERCVNAEKLWGLCSVFAEQAEAKLVIATSVEPAKCLLLLQHQRAGKVEYMTKMSFKPKQMDELMFTLFEEALLKRNGGDFDALDNDLVFALTERCNGNVLMALLAIERGALALTDLCSSEDAMFDEWFDSETWPAQLVTRRDNQDDTVLGRSAHARDWFYHTMRTEDVYLKAHAKLAETEDCLFHLTLANDLDHARQHILQLDKLNSQVQQDFSRALLDVQTYCKVQPKDLQCRIVANILLDSKPALLVDPRQLPFQLLARLHMQEEDKELTALLLQCRKFRSRSFSWFAPQRASFSSPYEYTELVQHFTVGMNNCGSSPSLCVLGCDALMPNLIFIANSGIAKILDLDTRKGLATLVCPSPASQHTSSSCWLVAVDSTCCIAVVAMDKRAFVWYLSNPRTTFHYDKQHMYTLGNDVECLEYSQYLPNLVLIGNSSDASAQLWQLPLQPSKTAFPKVIKTLRLPKNLEQSSVGDCCTIVAFVPQVAQNELVCTCFKLASNMMIIICLWNLTNEQCVGRFVTPETCCLRFRSDGLKFATGGEDGILRIWSVEKVMANLGTEKRLDCDSFVPHTTKIQAVSFLDENDLVATASALAQQPETSSLVQVFNRNELVYSTVQPTTLQLLPGGSDDDDDEEEEKRHLVCSFQNRVLVLDVSEQKEARKSNTLASRLTGPYPIAEKSVTCAVVNSKYLLLAQHGGEFCILEISNATLIKRLDLQSSSSASSSSYVLRQLWISTDGTRLRAQFEGGRELVWSIPSFEPYIGSVASSKDVKPTKLKRRRYSWNMFAACTAAVPLPHHHQSAAAAPAEMWQDHLILPVHLQVRGQNFVENEQFATATFDCKLLSVWRVPPHVMGEVLMVVLECETGVVHLLHQNLMSVASPTLQRRISA